MSGCSTAPCAAPTSQRAPGTDGTLIYTDELIAKVKKAFDVNLMKTVTFDEIESAADFLIDKIVTKNM